ncbi:MAG: enoyl-CoA hydratase/isomerase family protein [Saprospiraceae bacterium]
MSYQALLVETNKHVTRITLNRPDKLNAFNGTLITELHSALSEAADNEAIRVVVVKGAGRAWSAGVDLKSNAESVTTGGSDFLKLGIEINELLESMPKVTIAQVHGYCFTGALEFMLAFDMVYCDHATQIGDTHAKWGIVPGWGLTQRLTRRVGLLRAKQMTFRARRVKGEEAERIGLVTMSVPVGELDATIDQVIADILENSHSTIGTIKKLYNEGYAVTKKEGLAMELKINTEVNMNDSAHRVADFDKKKG